MEFTAQLDVDVVALEAEDEVTCLVSLTAPVPEEIADRPEFVRVFEASTQQLLAALNAQAPARHGPHETTRRVEREQALALGDLPYTRRTSPDPMRFIELSDPPATTADASPPRLGQAFVDIFGQRLKGLGISNFLTVTPDTTVKELAQFTAMLDNEALESFRFTLQWVEQGRPLEPGLKNTPQARLTARLLMEAMETVC